MLWIYSNLSTIKSYLRNIKLSEGDYFYCKLSRVTQHCVIINIIAKELYSARELLYEAIKYCTNITKTKSSTRNIKFSKGDDFWFRKWKIGSFLIQKVKMSSLSFLTKPHVLTRVLTLYYIFLNQNKLEAPTIRHNFCVNQF